jgi:hypothetical protein
MHRQHKAMRSYGPDKLVNLSAREDAARYKACLKCMPTAEHEAHAADHSRTNFTLRGKTASSCRLPSRDDVGRKLLDQVFDVLGERAPALGA